MIASIQRCRRGNDSDRAVVDVQQTLAERLPEGDPNGTVSEVAILVDGPKQRAAQRAANTAVENLNRATRKQR